MAAHSWPFQKSALISKKDMHTGWITRDIGISSKNKLFLMEIKKCTTDLNTLNYIKRYCKTLRKLIAVAKQNYFRSLV